MAEQQSAPDNRIPVTIFTGFLGAGKTTLLNWVLTANHGKKLAVIENEFGETGVDEEILVAREHSDEVMVEVKNGCICCTVRGDLVTGLENLYKKAGGKLDGVIIETTGLADPAPVCQTFFVEKSISQLYKIDAVITVVDAKHLLQHLREKKPEGVENESEEQVAFADRILLNKVDLVTPEELADVRKGIRDINGYAKIIETCLKKKPVEMSEILDLGAFELDRVTEMDPEFMDIDAEHKHDDSVSSVGFNFGPDQQLDLQRLMQWINTLIQKYSLDLFRYKGVIAVKGMEQKYVFQGVHMLFGGDFAQNWGDAERKSCFCFIGKNIARMDLKKGFEACIAKPLRWGENQKVFARTAEGYTPGVIIKTWNEGNAYRIRLKTPDRQDTHNVEVWAPIDDDRFVKIRED